MSDKKSFENAAKYWMRWAVKTFERSNSFTSLDKAEKELEELKMALVYGSDSRFKLHEYVDVMMCLLHSAAKEGFTMDQITEAFIEKANINYNREWVLDEGGWTYSHKKN